jgi:PAS domain S-box-containing protein
MKKNPWTVAALMSGLLLILLSIVQFAESSNWFGLAKHRTGQAEHLLRLVGQIAGITGLLSLGLISARKSLLLDLRLQTALRILSGEKDGAPQAKETGDTVAQIEASARLLHLDLAESRRKENFLIERAVDVICVIAVDGRIVSVNDACRNSWGYLRAELEGKHVSMLFVDSESSRVVNRLLGGIRSIARISFESQVRTREGHLVDVIWTGHWSAGESALFCIVHDISQRKMVERAVRQSEQRLRTILEALPAPVLVSSQEGKIEFANAAAGKLLGYTPAELQGLAMQEIFAISATGGLPGIPTGMSAETEASKKEGSCVHIELSCSCIDMADGQKILSVFLDRTAEQELQRTRRDFMAMITHDLRSPMQMLMNIFLLLEEGDCGELNEAGRGFIDQSRSAVDRIMRLINDILQSVTIESGNFTLSLSEFRLDRAIESALQTVRPAAEAMRISITTNLPELLCVADEQRIMQVLINLLSNAVKFSPPGGAIEVVLEHAGGQSVVSVCDQGRGIPADHCLLIFEKFKQVEVSDSHDKGGYGLGLAICKAIVESHGGKIGVESKPGKGSKFWFSLPLRSAQDS